MLKVVARGLRAHLMRLILTGLVVVMGVAFVCGSQLLSDTVKQGFDEVFSSRYESTDVVVRSSDSVFTFSGQQRGPVGEDILSSVRHAPGVGSAEGIVQAPVRLMGSDNKSLRTPGVGLALTSFGLNWAGNGQINQWRIVDGHAPVGEGEVVLDQGTAAANGLVVGDRIDIPFAQGTIAFQISGIARFKTNADYSGSAAVLFDTPTAQRYLVGDGNYSWIAATTQPGINPAQLRSTLQHSVGGRGELQVLTETDFVREDQDLYQRLITAVASLLVIFGCIALFVSSFVIYNTFSLIIAQRTRELALLRAFGASRSQVVWSVLTEAAIVGVVASTLGLGAGVVFAMGISRLLDSLGFLPTNADLVVRTWSFAPGFVLGVVVTITAGLFPAVRASRVPPVAAFRDHQAEPKGYSRPRMILGAVMAVSGGALLWTGLTSESLTRVGLGMALVFLGVSVLGPILVTPLSGLLGAVPAATAGVTGALARENSRRNPKRTAATTSALMVGVALVAFIAIIGQSFRAATAEAVDLAVMGDLVVNAPSVGLSGVSPALAEALNDQPEVAAAASLRVGIALADGRPSLFFGVNPEKLEKVVRFDVPEGSLSDLRGESIAVMRKIADEHHLSIGSQLHVHFQSSEPDQAKPPRSSGSSSGERTLKVVAIFDSELLRGSAGYLMSQGLFEVTFPKVQQSDLQTYVKLAPGVSPEQGRERLQPIVDRYPPAELQDLNGFKNARSQPIDRFVSFIWALLLMAVLIAAIGILNTLMLSVHERTRELGLLRAAGMSRSQVRASVRWEALIISIMGTTVGLGIGVFFGWAMVRAAADEGLRTFAVPVVQLCVIVMLAGGVGIVAAALPARRAANLDILEAITAE